MGQDQPEALGGVFEVLAGGLGGAAYRRFGGRVQAGAEPEQIHRAHGSDGAHVVSRRSCDAAATEGVAPLAGYTASADLSRRRGPRRRTPQITARGFSLFLPTTSRLA